MIGCLSPNYRIVKGSFLQLDAEMEFVKDSDGHISKAIIYGEEDGSVIKCPRI